MKQGDRKYEDRIFGHKKTAQARIGEFWAQKKLAQAGIEEFWAQKKPAEAGIEEFWTQKNRLKPAAWMVRLSGLEPPTPTMSR